MNRPILVGERVRIVAPAAFAGRTGRVVDVGRAGREFAIRLDAGGEVWVSASNLARPVDHSHRLRPAPTPELADVYVKGVIAVGRVAFVPSANGRVRS
jgi:hypothetical protein